MISIKKKSEKKTPNFFCQQKFSSFIIETKNLKFFEIGKETELSVTPNYLKNAK